MRRAVLALSLAVMLLVGCDQTGGDGSTDPTETVEPTDPEAEPTEPATLPPEFLECDPTRQPDDVSVVLADVDLTRATWQLPEGFVESDRFVEQNPPATQVRFWVAEPDPAGAGVEDAVAVAVHTGVDWSSVADVCLRVPEEVVLAWLEDFHDGIDVDVLGPAESVTIGGYPAVEQLRQFSDRTSLAAWLFSSEHVMVVYCQWSSETERSRIEQGCEALRESIAVP